MEQAQILNDLTVSSTLSVPCHGTDRLATELVVVSLAAVVVVVVVVVAVAGSVRVHCMR